MLKNIELTEINPKLHHAISRRHFLLRAIERGNVTQEQYDKEMPVIEKYIQYQTAQALQECSEAIKSTVVQVKQSISTDGDMKRTIANVLIKILKQCLTAEEVRGVFRQGYKVMRQE